MKKLFITLSAIILISLLTSCGGSAEFVSLNNTYYPETKECFYVQNPGSIGYKYEIIGHLQASRSSGELNDSDIKELKDKALQYGADAIIEVTKVKNICKAKALRYIRDSEGYPVRR